MKNSADTTALRVSTAHATQSTPGKVHIVITITYKPGKFEQTLEVIRKFAEFASEHGVDLVGSYTIAMGHGNRIIDIWAADSVEAWQKCNDAYLPLYDRDFTWAALDREDIEVAYFNHGVMPKAAPKP